MLNGYTKVEVISDKTKELFAGLKELSNVDVLVGIPEEGSAREDDEINNAQLAFIHTHGVRAASMRSEMDKEMKKGSTYSKAHEMYLQAHGSPLWHVPPRPIIEPAIEDPENQEIIAEPLAQAVKDALDGNTYAMMMNLEKAGILGQNAVRDWFTNPKNNWPENSPLTIAKKGSSNPLIDTGELRKAITYVVRKD